MKTLVATFIFLLSFAAMAEALNGGGGSRVEECRRKMHSNQRSRLYIEDMEYCQNLLMRDSLEKFNSFSEQRAPAVDCEEAKDASSLVNACRAVGIQKVKAEARAKGITIRDQDVYVCEVDNSHWIFSNYVWFCADTPRGKLQHMTQKPRFQSCF